MNTVMIILRIIHILSGVFWVGFAFFNIVFLQPTIKATGAEGQKTFQYLMRQTRLMTTVYIAATLTTLTGILQYGYVSHLQSAFLASGWGMVLTVGSVSGIIAWFLAIFSIRSLFNRIGHVGQEIQASNGAPAPELVSKMAGLVSKLGHVGNVALVFMVISTIGMAAARYSIF